MKKEKVFQRVLELIGQDFDRRMIEDPDFFPDLPPNAYVIFQIQIEGDAPPALREQVEEFNAWVRKLSEAQIDPDHQPVDVLLKVRFLVSSEEHPHRSQGLGYRKLSKEMIEHTPREFALSPT